MKSKVYVETTIVSYLTAEPTRDVIQAAHQQLTREWWDRRGRFDLFVSQTVITESSGGSPEAASRRCLPPETPRVGAVCREPGKTAPTRRSPGEELPHRIVTAVTRG